MFKPAGKVKERRIHFAMRKKTPFSFNMEDLGEFFKLTARIYIYIYIYISTYVYGVILLAFLRMKEIESVLSL